MPRHGIPFTAFNRSSMRELVIGIDSGTQSTKALVVDANNGKVLGEGAKAHRLIGGLPAGAKEQHPADWIDACTRCTYNLFTAAAEAGVRRVIYLSSLDLFLPYDEDMVVNERWRPRPTTEPAVMAPYLGEFIAEEFCLEGGFDLVCLRLGHLVEHREVEEQQRDGNDQDRSPPEHIFQ